MKLFGIDLCRFKEILGRPRERIHSYRLFDIAVIDVAVTIMIALVIVRVFGFVFWKSLAASFIMGIISHRVFCVSTKVDKLLFSNI